jgi:hypothetical protein
MAEDRARAASEHRSQLASARWHFRTADRVDASVQRMQTACSEPLLDRPSQVAEPDQLAASDNSVLSHGQIDDRLVTGSSFCSHGVHKRELESIRPGRLCLW